MPSKPTRAPPIDLVIIVVITVLTFLSVSIPGVRETGVRTILGLLFVVVCPGYAVAAALFPESSDGTVDPDNDVSAYFSTQVTSLERAAISLGLSLSIVPLIGFGLTFTPRGIRLFPILSALAVVTVLAVAVAVRRRAGIPSNRRFQPSIGGWIGKLGGQDSRLERHLNVLLIFSILLAASTIVFSIAFPGHEEDFTEFYILSENENGSLVAQGFPSSLDSTSENSIHIGINNKEGEQVDYIVITELQQTTAGQDSTEVVSTRRVGRMNTTINSNESWVREFEVKPIMTGENVRLVFLLYREEVPADPDIENAYRAVHIWINTGPQDDSENLATSDDVRRTSQLNSENTLSSVTSGYK